MAGASNIEWTDDTWNPIVGCSIVSPGCTNCYAMKMAARIEAMARASGGHHAGHYAGTTKKVKGNAVWTGMLALAPENILLAPLHWKKPRLVFVNSMGDLFHEDAPDEWIDKVFAVMALSPQHQFQVLTKRAERMREYLSDEETPVRVALTRNQLSNPEACLVGVNIKITQAAWPLPNVWLGVSAERQQEANERIPQLLQTPAAIRFVSCEPLLGPIDLTNLGDVAMSLNAFTGEAKHLLGMRDKTLGALDWIIVGGESGPGARPFDVDWAHSLLRQCKTAGAAAFMKQLGSNPHSDGRPLHGQPRGKYDDPARWSPELRIREFPEIRP